MGQTWYTHDGTRLDDLPSEPDDVVLYIKRGLLPYKPLEPPTVADPPPPEAPSDPLVHALSLFMRGKEAWEGTPTALKDELDGVTVGGFQLDTADRRWPVDAPRLSIALTERAPEMQDLGVAVSRGYRGHERVIRLHRRY